MTVKVLFVCMGNICRSPAAAAVFSKYRDISALQDVIEIDSAGTHDYHIGEQADARMRLSAMRRGIDLEPHRARQVSLEDIHHFDYILVMDENNLNFMRDKFGSYDHVRLLMEFVSQPDSIEVPDPYYGGNLGFEKVLDMVDESAKGLLETIRSTYHL